MNTRALLVRAATVTVTVLTIIAWAALSDRATAQQQPPTLNIGPNINLRINPPGGASVQPRPSIQAIPIQPSVRVPGSFPLVCRGGVRAITFSQFNEQESQILFTFSRSFGPASQGLADGRCSWLDRGMRQNEFEAVCHQVGQVNIVTAMVEGVERALSGVTWELKLMNSAEAPYLSALRDPEQTVTLFVVRDDGRRCFRVTGLPNPASAARDIPRTDLLREVMSREEAVASIERMRIASSELRALVGLRPPGSQIGPQRVFLPQDVARVNQVASELDLAIRDWEARLNTRGDDAQLANIELQNILQRQQQTLQTISNVSKALHDTAMAIIRKMGG